MTSMPVRRERIMSSHIRPWRRRLVPWVFILPFLLSFVAFFAYPAVYSLVLSFYQYAGYGSPKPVGWHNYFAALTFPFFWQALYNTLFYWLVHMVPTIVISFLLAVAIHSRWVRHKKPFQLFLFLPQVIPVIAAALVWKFIFANSGALNAILGTHIDWLENPSIAKWSVVIFLSWLGIAWLTVIFTAGLTTISPDIEDAATIDGARGIRLLWNIYIPLMKPIFLFAFLIDAVGSLQMFARPNVLISSGPLGGGAPPFAMPILNLVFTNIQNGAFGLASAYGWLIFIMIAIVAVVQFKVFNLGGQQ